MGWFLAGWLHVTGFPIIDIQLQFDLVAPFVGYGAVNGADGGWQGVGAAEKQRFYGVAVFAQTGFQVLGAHRLLPHYGEFVGKAGRGKALTPHLGGQLLCLILA